MPRSTSGAKKSAAAKEPKGEDRAAALREARRQLAKEQRERAEKMAKVQAQKQRRAAKEQHAKLMKEFNRYRDRLEAVGGQVEQQKSLPGCRRRRRRRRQRSGMLVLPSRGRAGAV